MEEQYVNKIELAGRVGAISRKVIGGTEYARFQLCTIQTYNNGECPLKEISWHDCHALASDGVDTTKIEKGGWLHIIGRLEYRKYVDSNSTERQLTEIMVTKIINDEEG